MSLGDIYEEFRQPGVQNLMPNIRILLLLANLSPVGNAVVERLFSLMKLTKTYLRNRLGDSNLDMLLRINKEAPDQWTDDQKEDLVNLWEERKGKSSKMDI